MKDGGGRRGCRLALHADVAVCDVEENWRPLMAGAAAAKSAAEQGTPA